MAAPSLLWLGQEGRPVPRRVASVLGDWPGPAAPSQHTAPEQMVLAEQLGAVSWDHSGRISTCVEVLAFQKVPSRGGGAGAELDC